MSGCAALHFRHAHPYNDALDKGITARRYAFEKLRVKGRSAVSARHPGPADAVQRSEYGFSDRAA
jgi:hypothetical protein